MPLEYLKLEERADSLVLSFYPYVVTDTAFYFYLYIYLFTYVGAEKMLVCIYHIFMVERKALCISSENISQWKDKIKEKIHKTCFIFSSEKCQACGDFQYLWEWVLQARSWSCEISVFFTHESSQIDQRWHDSVGRHLHQRPKWEWNIWLFWGLIKNVMV